MEITEVSLKNMLRHAYLCGYNSFKTPFDAWEAEREEVIGELINEQKEDQKTCYGDQICECKEEPEEEIPF
jgi:hypothetical protein